MIQAPDAVTILQLTDLHLMASPDGTLLGMNTAHYFHAVLEQALSEQQAADLLLLTGDLAQDPDPASYEYLLKHLEQAPIPSVCLPGNHDDLDLMRKILATEQVNCRKQLLLGNWQIICLNSQIPGSPAGQLPDEELLFLQHCLSAYPKHHALIAVHHHCLPTHSAWMDTMIIANHEAFLTLVDSHQQEKVVLTGHIHQEMDRRTGAIRVLATPSTCFQFAPASATFKVDNTAPGYRILKLYADGRMDSGVFRLPGHPEGLDTDNQGY